MLPIRFAHPASSTWDSWNRHMDLSMRLTRQDLSDSNAGCRQTDVFYGCRVLNSIVNLLVFEVSMAKPGDWIVHLSAATSQLDRVFQIHGLKDGKYHLHSVLLSMQRPSIFDGTDLDYHVWSADQASFQFSSAVIIYADIIASICLRQVPRLQHCHDALIAKSGNCLPKANQLLHMEHYFGCYGWALLLIGEVAALDAWKLANVSDNGSDLEEFLVLGKQLETNFYHGLERLQSVSASSESSETTNQSDQHGVVTKLWLHAGLVYLSNLMYGFQPADPAIHANVHAALNLVKVLVSTLNIRCPIWPLCIAGCMAQDDEKLELRRLMSELPPLQSFGPNKESVNIIEAAWLRRGQLEENAWNLADCFRCQGSTLLLL